MYRYYNDLVFQIVAYYFLLLLKPESVTDLPRHTPVSYKISPRTLDEPSIYAEGVNRLTGVLSFRVWDD